jgi:hypothetical protein
MLMTERQPVVVSTPSGAKVEVLLEEWVEALIDRALAKHRVECPFNDVGEIVATERAKASMSSRIESIELKLKIVQWLMAPVYGTLVIWLINVILSHISP